MSNAAQTAHTVRVGEPDRVDALTVYPLLLEPEHAGRYLGLAAALERGATITELPDRPQIDTLVVHNPLDRPLLIYRGEHVIGARQDRVFASSSLVAAGTSVPVPVVCVEEGRWHRGDGKRPSLGSQTAYPRLRRLLHGRAERASTRAGAPSEVQAAVWKDIAATTERCGVSSPTRALRDIYRRYDDRLGAVAEAIALHAEQVGALVAIGGRFVVLDYVGEPGVWQRLHDALLQGYALDALDAREIDPPGIDDAREFMAMLWQMPHRTATALGLGESVRVDFGALAATGVAWRGDTIALSAFERE
jgi:hypothetical protein